VTDPTANDSRLLGESGCPSASIDDDGCCADPYGGQEDTDCIDVDGDGLNRAEELALGTSYLDPDTDDDGFRDGDEMNRGTSPLNGKDFPSGFAGMEALAGDTHVHGATPQNVVPNASAEPYECSSYPGSNHSAVACDRLFQRGRDAGLDWMPITHHHQNLTLGVPYGWDGTEYVTPCWGYEYPNEQDPDYGRSAKSELDDNFCNLEYNASFEDYRYPTHANGYPLWTRKGFTEDTTEYLYDCAEAQNDDEFSAFAAVERTTSMAWGGHKTVLLPSTVAMRYPGSATPVFSQDLLEVGGIANISHPWEESFGERFAYIDIADDANKGFDNRVVVGVELDKRLEFESGDPHNRSYRSALDLGFRLHPTVGSDTHSTHANSGCDGTLLPIAGSVCWVGSEGRDGILDAMKGHQCYATRKGTLPMEFSIADRPMGAVISTDLLGTTTANSVPIQVLAQRGALLAEFSHWDLIHNGVVAYTGTCDADACEFEGDISSDRTQGYYYIRVRNEDDDKTLLVSAPIWVVAPNPVAELALTGSSKKLPLHSCTPLTVSLLDKKGQAVSTREQGYPVTVDTSSQVAVFADASCTEPLSTLDMEPRQASATFYMWAYEEGAAQVTITTQNGLETLGDAVEMLVFSP